MTNSPEYIETAEDFLQQKQGIWAICCSFYPRSCFSQQWNGSVA